MGPETRVAYVLKMYPRFSETFIVNEVLAHEAAGTDVRIVSLRAPADGRFHESLAEVRAPVTYLRHKGWRAEDLWTTLEASCRAWPDLPSVLPELLAAEVDDAAQALQLAALVRAEGITHLHAHFASVATTVARLASLITGVPYTFTAHAKDIFHAEVDDTDLARKISSAVACVTVSDFNADHLRGLPGSSPDRVVRIYNGLDLTRFPHRPDPGDAGEVDVVAVGRLVEKKGFDVLLDAVAELHRRGRPVRCDVVGAGPLEGALRRRVLDLGLDRSVRLLGPRPQGQVRRAVQGATVLAAPCVVAADGNRDGMPTVLLESMALGTPVVATGVTGVPELVQEGVTGLLVAQGDATALADALARLLDEPALRARLSAAARERVELDFDVRHQAAALRDVFARASQVPREAADDAAGAGPRRAPFPVGAGGPAR